MDNNIKKDYLWNTIGVLAQNAISPLLLIVVTRINGIYDSGLFSFAFSVAIIFWVVSMWGGRTYQVSDMDREFSHRSYVMVRLVLTVLILVGAIAFSIVNQYDYFKTGLILVLVLFKAIESVADAIHGILQVNDRLYIAGKSLTYKAIGGFAAFTALDILTHNILLGAAGIAMINITLILVYDLRKARQLESVSIPPSQFDHVVKNAVTIMRRTWPIFVVILLSMFSLNIPRYFIDLYHQEQIGYFGILAMPITLIGLVMAFILQPQVVYLSKTYNQKQYVQFKRTVRELMLITTGIGFIILVGAYVVGVPALNLVFGVDFSSYMLPLIVIVLGGIINAVVSIFINIFTIIRRFKQQFYVLLITNIFLALFSASLIKTYGLFGGVALFTVANFIQASLLFISYEFTFRQTMKHH